MWPTFADPKTDFIFKRIFGIETHKQLLIELLNTLLELEAGRRILDLTYLTPDQSVPIAEMKLSVVDVKCRDERGHTYVVEMQVLNVEGMEKRIIYNTSKAYVMQLRQADDYAKLCPVVGVTLCNFVFWPDQGGQPRVPMLSRWRLQEQHSGKVDLSDVQYVFLELPKYTLGNQPRTMVDHWAYFFREARNFTMVPSALADAPFRSALEVARTANFTPEEWELYDRSKIAEQDARGALSLARREGRQEGKEEGRAEGKEEGREEGEAQRLRANIKDLCGVLEIEWTAERAAESEGMNLAELETFWNHLVTKRRMPDNYGGVRD